MCYKCSKGDDGKMFYTSVPTTDMSLQSGRFMFACVKSKTKAIITYTSGTTYAPYAYVGTENNITELPIVRTGSSSRTDTFDISGADYFWYVVKNTSGGQKIRFE